MSVPMNVETNEYGLPLKKDWSTETAFAGYEEKFSVCYFYSNFLIQDFLLGGNQLVCTPQASRNLFKRRSNCTQRFHCPWSVWCWQEKLRGNAGTEVKSQYALCECDRCELFEIIYLLQKSVFIYLVHLLGEMQNWGLHS